MWQTGQRSPSRPSKKTSDSNVDVSLQASSLRDVSRLLSISCPQSFASDLTLSPNFWRRLQRKQAMRLERSPGVPPLLTAPAATSDIGSCSFWLLAWPSSHLPRYCTAHHSSGGTSSPLRGLEVRL